MLQQIASAEEKKREESERRVALAEEKRAAKRQKVEDGVPQETKKAPREKKTYDNPLRARRVRLYPTPEQDAKLGNFFGAVRFCYNMLVEKYRIVGQGGVNLAAMRKTIVDGPA